MAFKKYNNTTTSKVYRAKSFINTILKDSTITSFFKLGKSI